ncbi:stage III sporulation protein AB [Oscillospiraceae bacterium PP1C4]
MFILLKVSGMILIIICTTSIGMAMARTLSKRVSELKASIAVLGALERELSYSLTPPDEAIAKLEQLESFAAVAFLPACASLCRQGIPFPSAWRRAVHEQRGELMPDDVTILANLSETLGQYDLEGQLSRINQAKMQLQFQLDGARERCKTHSKLYRTMGLLSGAFIVIVFI